MGGGGSRWVGGGEESGGRGGAPLRAMLRSSGSGSRNFFSFFRVWKTVAGETRGQKEVGVSACVGLEACRASRSGKFIAPNEDIVVRQVWGWKEGCVVLASKAAAVKRASAWKSRCQYFFASSEKEKNGKKEARGERTSQEMVAAAVTTRPRRGCSFTRCVDFWELHTGLYMLDTWEKALFVRFIHRFIATGSPALPPPPPSPQSKRRTASSSCASRLAFTMCRLGRRAWWHESPSCPLRFFSSRPSAPFRSLWHRLVLGPPGTHAARTPDAAEPLPLLLSPLRAYLQPARQAVGRASVQASSTFYLTLGPLAQASSH